MKRVVVKGTRIKAASNPQQEPNFYQLPPVDQSMSSGNLSNVNIDTCLESSVAIVTSSQPAANGAVVTSVTQQHQAPPVQLPTSAAQQEAGCLGWFRHMVPFGDAIFDNMFDDGTDSESVDVAMILDFCSDWAPVK
jgi:hypothetical protein